jgi:hypothetical protein
MVMEALLLLVLMLIDSLAPAFSSWSICGEDSEPVAIVHRIVLLYMGQYSHRLRWRTRLNKRSYIKSENDRIVDLLQTECNKRNSSMHGQIVFQGLFTVLVPLVPSTSFIWWNQLLYCTELYCSSCTYSQSVVLP